MSYPYQYVENYSTTPTTPHASPWEVDQNQAEMLQAPQLPQAYDPHPTIQLQEQPLPEPERMVPSQHLEHHPSPILLYPVHEGRSEGNGGGGGGDAKPQNPHVDTVRHSNSPAGSSTMPLRHAPTRPHLQLASHPYRRPQSASGGSSVRASRERQHVRFASTGQPVSASTSSMPSRLTSSYVSSFPTTATTTSSPATSPHSTTTTTIPRPERTEPRRFIIRADVYYDAESKVITAMLELPGVKKADLSVKLSTCTYNRVKQVTVSGTSSPLFPDESGFAVRERKHGEFARTFAVPPDTKIEDIHAEMQDGLLLLRIACHLAAEPEDAQEVQIH